ncbi:L-threonylcarbamoyladenylate synthase [Desulfovibrio aminophilus]|uniref:L-threonylcarbamoyladenylate synthase n=1 Tax=Desulfovibrio aminophilus TaxID=81425 RepID=UPI00339AC0DB
MREELPDITAAVDALLHGGVLVYPTETLYALGCDARNIAAVSRVLRLKGRPENKPLPVVVADLDGLERILEGEMPEDVLRLGERFWPGPLSILVHTRGLASAVRDGEGFTSVRVTAHPLAAALCAAAGAPLVATSANLSGEPAAAVPEELDPVLAVRADLVLDQKPWPSGGLASTVVALEGSGRLRLIRAGAVPVQALEVHGFTVSSGN